MKVGLFGGSFNPPHIGHLIVASDICEELELDQILFIPSYDPPHKRVSVPFADRVAMTKLATAGDSRFKVIDVEKSVAENVARGERTYTVHVLEWLKSIYLNDSLYFIIGTDQYAELETWKAPQRLSQFCTLVVVQRPRFEIMERDSHILYKTVSQIDISSHVIRERIRNKGSVRYLIPERVEKYIRRKKLYL